MLESSELCSAKAASVEQAIYARPLRGLTGPANKAAAVHFVSTLAVAPRYATDCERVPSRRVCLPQTGYCWG